MRTGRPVAKIELSAEIAGILEGYTQRRKTAQALALRARIVLGCAAGLSAVAAHERVTPQTVGKWRRRFVERGLDGLLDEPRPGVPRKIGDGKVESVILQTLESRPLGATHWSTRSMARHSGISTSSVIWRAFGLQPHRLETFKLSTDPLFVAKVRDVVGLYLIEAALDKAPSPLPDGLRGYPFVRRHRLVAQPGGTAQHDARPQRQCLRRLAPLRVAFQDAGDLRRQFDLGDRTTRSHPHPR